MSRRNVVSLERELVLVLVPSLERVLPRETSRYSRVETTGMPEDNYDRQGTLV